MKRATQRQETRRRVVDRATRLCRRDGFIRTRTADVAAAAGLSHGAVFVHFPTREQLLQEVAERMGSRITDRLYALAAANAKLDEQLRAQLQCIEEEEDLYRHLVIENALLPLEVQAVWTGILSAIATHLSTALTSAMESGAIRRAPLHLVFNMWIGLVHHYVIHKALFVSKGSVLRKHGPELVDFFLYLMAKGS